MIELEKYRYIRSYTSYIHQYSDLSFLKLKDNNFDYVACKGLDIIRKYVELKNISCRILDNIKTMKMVMIGRVLAK